MTYLQAEKVQTVQTGQVNTKMPRLGGGLMKDINTADSAKKVLNHVVAKLVSLTVQIRFKLK